MAALPALAQEGEAPPVVAPEAPALDQPGSPAETAPAAPSADTAPEAAAPEQPAAIGDAPAAPATAPDGTGGAEAPDAAAPAEDAGADAAAPDAAEAAANPAPLPLAETPVETDLSSLVLKAHPVVQAVMALLAASVFAVLTIFLFKAVEFQLAFGRMARTARAIAAAEGVPAVAGDGPLAETARAAAAELAALPERLTPDLRASARERLDLSLERIEAGAVQRLRGGTGLLASIGAVAPFVGLFGTVFGIMNSFLAIAETKTTNLAVVAPGIAEALLATGIGLVAAIPAVLLYNRTMRRIAAFRHRLADGTADVLQRFSRALDARMGG
ncbi:tonB-system energizer ExbB [Rhodobacter sp. SGA-6-6]|uniref:MotA/TolQ/ExbB proton channel family protein n=1 Tax=Rhodobacter sp. SGA-6-6 TaxID=2710882 RepID=UPI0013ECD76A|nr:MotA/TolQ/ExbB proton channel family protein [Rhodobacter sp. SGA-6-6]NGM46333.1 tonB-system energizer ExbB [Rhodobacter sp. SGA-6-6]